jgi:PAS domain S-box-containing protein
MKKKGMQPQSHDESLRHRAEARFTHRPQDALVFERDPVALLHELQVHQIELEIQNEELRASQSHIEESRKRFVELYEFAPVGYCTLDEAGVVRHVNLTLTALLGYSRRYVLGKQLASFVAREDKDSIFLFLRSLRQMAAQHRCELRLKTKGGELLFVELISVPHSGTEPGQTSFLLAVLEIGARKEVERLAQTQRVLVERNNAFLASVLEGIRDAFIAVDGSGILTYVNKNAELLFGRRRAAVLGKPYGLAFPESKTIVLTEQQCQTLHRGSPLSFEFFYAGKPLRNWYEIRLYPFSEGFCAFVTVINERKRIQEALEEHARQLDFANKELEAFSYSVSHDLRNPLHNIASMAEMLRNCCSATLDEEGLSCVSYIESNVKRMAQLISDLLEFSRLAREDMAVGACDLSALAWESIRELERHDPQRQVEVVVAEGLTVLADPKLMKIAMDNLVGNAWKYTSRTPAARIEVGGQQRNGIMEYYVRDNGAGFDLQQAQKLFVPFQRLHSDAHFSGTGIGLSIVARIIARHNGRIWAAAEPNKGATFFFILGTATFQFQSATELDD